MNKMFFAFNTRRNALITALVTAAATGAAGAQTAPPTTADLGLNGMVTDAGGFVTSLLSSNAGPLLRAMLPIMGFIFIKNQVRSIF